MVDPVTTSAITWSLSAASWLISPLLSRFLNKFFDALGIDLPPKFQSRKQTLIVKLEKLQTTVLPQLLILTDAALQSPHRPFLENWLQNLKAAFYEAEHVLGLVEYRRLQKEVNSLFPSSSKFNLRDMKGKLPNFSSEKKNLIKSLEKLEILVNEALEFVSLLSLPSSSATDPSWRNNDQHRKTISVPGSTVIGRDQDRDALVRLLREDVPESSSNAKCYSVIGIWGMGGSGKTTLAQYVCDYEKEAKYFDRVMWAHVSQKFSVDSILKMIWESAFKEACPDFGSLEGLQLKLEERLRGEKYFLVLDDVWCDKGVSEQELEQLFVPLRAGKRGSKVLVTTRIEAAAIALGAMYPIPLRELDDEQFMLLFISNAIGDVQIGDDQVMGRLLFLGKKFVEKLSRLPLAAKTVAGQLRRRLDPDFWLSMLDRGLLNDTMGALLLSYQHLTPPLQRCFAFCSFFSKGESFSHDELVNLWIAEGFIETENANQHMKDVANWYILELISCSFFQVGKTDSSVYSMHDLMHDLAQHVSGSECLIIGSDEIKEIPRQTRHLSIADNMLGEHVEKICKLTDLRTIVVSASLVNFSSNQVNFDALFMKLRKLYVIDIHNVALEKFPKSVGQLRNLRFLRFVVNDEDAIPESLNRHYQLRVLYIRRPIPYVGRLVSIPDIGKLILLQDLEVFYVRAMRGFELKQLMHLKDLSGSLSIFNLHNVESIDEACQAKLSEKKGLDKLLFSWDYNSKDVMRDVDVEILEGLCPPPQIKEVAIKGYSGKMLPRWILESHMHIAYLKHLELVDCGGLESLQRVNELSSLLSLSISLPKLKIWGALPINLTQLKISHCLSLSFVSKEDLEMITSIRNTKISQIVNLLENSVCRHFYSYASFHFNHVQELMKLGGQTGDEADSTILGDLKRCLEKRLDFICELKSMYSELTLPHALKKLSIGSCFITDKILARSFQVLATLTQLVLYDIITLTCISKEVLGSLTSLTVLVIGGCLLLSSIGGLGTHNKIEKVVIECCPILTFEMPIILNDDDANTMELTSSLGKKKTRSSILKDASLTGCMPSDDMLQDLVSLETLSIKNCPTIVNPHIGHLKSLVKLTVEHCPNLVSLRGLRELNIQCLNVDGCEQLNCYSDSDKLPQLKKLLISHRWSLLEQLVSRDGLSSLVSLELSHAHQEYFSQEECQVFHYLSSLETITFGYCEMRILPNLLRLHSLRYLTIKWCENLTSLQDLPTSVQTISITHCNQEFTRSCKNPNESNWHRIYHIPRKHIF